MLHLAALLLPLAAAVPCVQFDTNWNLYAFGGSQDVNLGGSSSWAQPSVTPLTSSGRPPWTGNNTQCLLSQYNNAMYVIGGDSSNPQNIYIYNFAAGTWSTQSTTSVPSTLGNSRSSTVLDHDTNVFFTLSGNTLYQLDFGTPQITSTASSSAQAWSSVENPSFNTQGYTVTAASASNHINYFGVPGTAAGSADIFVVHFAYFQPTAQSYPTVNGGATFPDTAGQAISIPNSANNVQTQMVFVPNDFSHTYVVSHWTNPSSYNDTSGAPYATSLINSTQLLPAPSSTDLGSAYAASPSSIVQIDSGGNLYYINNAIGSDATVQSGAAWQKIGYTLPGTGGTASNSTTASSGGSSTSAASASSGTMSMSQSGTASASGSAAASTSSRAAAGRVAELTGVLGGVAAMIAALL